MKRKSLVQNRCRSFFISAVQTLVFSLSLKGERRLWVEDTYPNIGTEIVYFNSDTSVSSTTFVEDSIVPNSRIFSRNEERNGKAEQIGRI